MHPDSTTQVIAESYDDVPYGFLAIPIAHPTRLAAAGARHHIDVAPVSRSRVLELGCAEGGHLLNMACDYPGASFVGIELSPLQAGRARDVVRELGLSNVEVHRANVADLGDELTDQLGSFDYIICHGVYSWVPRDVRDALLGICRRHLAPQGLAMVSYNARPGFDVRAHLRSIVLDHVASLTDRHERIAATRELLSSIATMVDQRNPYSALVQQAIDDTFSGGDSYLAHEYLEHESHPLFLHEFAAHAHAHGLRYLDDLIASGAPAIITSDGAPPRGLEDLRDQHLYDLVNGIGFRAAVLCPDELVVDQRPDPRALRSLHITAPLRPDGHVEISDSSLATFDTRSGRHISTPIPQMKAVLLELAEAWPSSIPVISLLAEPSFEDDVLRELDEMSRREIAWFTSEPIVHARRVSDRPSVPPITRLTLRLGERTANRQYESVPLDELLGFVAALLDGTRTAADVTAAALTAVTGDRLAIVDREGKVMTDLAAISSILPERVADAIETLCRLGMIEA